MSASVHTATEETFLNATRPEQGVQGGTPLIISAMFISLAVIGVLGNSLVLVVLASISELRTIPNLLIANQSLLDLTASTFLPLRLISDIPVHIERPIEGALVCIFVQEYFFFWLAMIGSTFNLVVITIERYYAVVYPIRYRAHANYKLTVIAACVPWLIGLLACSQLFFTSRVGPSGKCVWNFPESYKSVFGVAIFVTQYTLPLWCMVFAYIRIFVSLQAKFGNKPVRPSSAKVSERHSVTTLGSGAHETTTNDASDVGNSGKTHVAIDNRRIQEGTINTVSDSGMRARGKESAPIQLSYRERARKNIIVTLLIVSLTYFVCWTPNQIMYMVYNLGVPINFQGTIYLSSITLAFCNICVNPFIYTLKYRRFRKGLKKLFFKEKRKPPRETPKIVTLDTAVRTQI